MHLIIFNSDKKKLYKLKNGAICVITFEKNSRTARIESSGIGLNTPLGNSADKLCMKLKKSGTNMVGKSKLGNGICTGATGMPNPGTVGGGGMSTLI